ncbi:MAG: hypothetical protein U0V56_06775 [Actinomycetota bacterium]
MAVETIDITRLREVVPVTRHPGLIPARVVARRVLRGALIWGAVFGFVTWVEVSSFAKEYPTLADRARAAVTYGSNIGLQAIFGPVHHIGTVAGYTAFHDRCGPSKRWACSPARVWFAARRRLDDGVACQQDDAASRGRRGTGRPRIGLLTLWTVAAAVTVSCRRGARRRFHDERRPVRRPGDGCGGGDVPNRRALCSQLSATRAPVGRRTRRRDVRAAT